MAEATLDLTDDQIEQLLSAAEVSLANKSSQKAVVVTNKQQSLAVPATAPAAQAVQAAQADGKPSRDAVKRSEELTLRVPQRRSKEKKAVPDNAGADWNHMPRTKIEDPEVKREHQLLRLRGVLDPKKHFKKDTRKDPFPQYSQMGTLIEGPTEYYSGRLNRKERKQTLVEEVLASGDASNKFKTRYEKIQEKKTSGKKTHYKKLMARRKRG